MEKATHCWEATPLLGVALRINIHTEPDKLFNVFF